jgi:hypothetical protein
MLVDLATGEREDDRTEPPTPAEEFARSGDSDRSQSGGEAVEAALMSPV